MYLDISSALWVVWYVYWIVSARNRIRDTNDSIAKRESAIGRLGYTALVVVGFGLVIWHPLHPDLQKRLWPSSGEWVGVGLAIETAVSLWPFGRGKPSARTGLAASPPEAARS